MENVNAVATEEDEYEIRGIMGDHFRDLSKENGFRIKDNSKPEPKFVPMGKKVEVTQTFSKDKAEWVKRGKFLGQMAIATVINLLVFSWEQQGLMAASIATPCMWACMAVAGYNVCRIIVSLEGEV